MLQIRQEQYATFNDEVRSRYHQTLLRYYRATIPETVAQYNDNILFARIAAADTRGRELGITLQDSMARFIGLDLIMGECFDLTPDVQRYFEAPGISIDMKVHVLADLVQRNVRKYTGLS